MILNLLFIIFIDYNIWFKPNKLGDDIDIRRYIINDCGNRKFKWWSSAPRLKNSPHLEKLKVFLYIVFMQKGKKNKGYF